MSRDRKTTSGWLCRTEQYSTAVEYVAVHISKTYICNFFF